MNTTLKFGIIGGLLLSSLLTAYLFDLYQYSLFNKIWTVFELLILVIVILLAVKAKKKSDNNEINYRDAIFTGLSVNFVAALIHSFAFFILFFLSPQMLEKFKVFIIKQEAEVMKSLKIPADKIKANIEFIHRDFTPFNLAKDNFMKILILGLIFTLVIAFFQRNKAGTNNASLK